MKTVESADFGNSLPFGELRNLLQEHPVRVGILFGSHATGETHRGSDIDIAVEFESIARDEPAYNDAFLGLSADLSDALGTDDVDLVDVHTLSPSVARAVLDHGILLVGDRDRAERLLRRRTAASSGKRTPRERFEAALGRIDEHLGGDVAVPATDDSRGKR